MVRHVVRLAALALVLVCALPAQADYAAGKRAWDAMRPAEALKEWRAAANAGDRRAMLALGRLYMRGLGAPQDYVEAHVWFNLAAARGEMAAVKERDALAAKMTPQQIASAQERARSWRPGGSERKQAAPSPPLRAISEAQELLAALGYKPGPADGRWGARTARAYMGFLRDAGLPRGDVLTPSGLRAMRAAARSKRPAPAINAPPRRTVRPGALHRAVLAGNTNGLKAALAAGANVNARDAQGWTALMHAVNKGYVLMVGPLLDAKADPDIRASDGATALFMAAVHGHSEIIELLMKAGADPSIEGPKGRTAKDLLVIHLKRRWPAGKVFRDCPECPEMVVVPAGSFMMGSPPHEKSRRSSEGPRHRVTVSRPFAVGKYEVTFAEWEACVSDGGCGDHRPDERSWGRGHRPVINVSWDDVKAYVLWLSSMTGKEYRLLSEAEWEYAARARTTTPFHFGLRISRSKAKYDSFQTVAVGSYPANGFGLHDLHGNVWEWVEDCWNGSYVGAPSDGRAWISSNCVDRVLRGGSWNNKPRNLRSANRDRYGSGIRSSSVGFRVARTLTF
ncbi:MAG: SUMF1/EgtB/PvdO family nonheme iron enzyme [Nitrospinae bacterium]|nr:SUMF1/EgtB/PvdO family nonheme iron enzyme [Nitrospinota bacterium]